MTWAVATFAQVTHKPTNTTSPLVKIASFCMALSQKHCQIGATLRVCGVQTQGGGTEGSTRAQDHVVGGRFDRCADA